MKRSLKSTGKRSPRESMSVRRLWAASRPVRSLPERRTTSPGCHVLTSARVTEGGAGLERGGRDHDGAAAVEMDVQVAGGGAVGDHGYWEIGRVGGEVLDLDVEDGGEAAEALCSDA